MPIYHALVEVNLNYCPLIWMKEIKLIWKTLKIYKSELSEWFLMIIPQQLLKWAKTCTLEIRWKRQLVTEVYKATHYITPPYITSLFPPKIVNYDLRSNMPISQSKFQTRTHGYHSLRNEGTRLWAAWPNACKEAKDISTFKRIVVDFISL